MTTTADTRERAMSRVELKFLESGECAEKIVGATLAAVSGDPNRLWTVVADNAEMMAGIEAEAKAIEAEARATQSPARARASRARRVDRGLRAWPS